MSLDQLRDLYQIWRYQLRDSSCFQQVGICTVDESIHFQSKTIHQSAPEVKSSKSGNSTIVIFMWFQRNLVMAFAWKYVQGYG